MLAEDRAAVKVGTFVLLGIVLLVGGITLGRGLRLEAAWQSLYIIFPQASGLEVGDPVTVRGVRRGIVLDFHNVPAGVLVQVGLDRLEDITAEAKPQLLMLEITGGRKVEIDPGTAPHSVQDGDTLYGIVGVDIPALLTMTQQFVDTTMAVLAQLQMTMRSLNATLLRPQTLQQLQMAIRNFQHVMARLDQVTATHQQRLERILVQVDRMTALLQQLLAKHQETFDTTISNIARLSYQLVPLTREFQQIVRQADTILRELRPAVRRMNSKQTLIGRFLQDSTLSRRVDTVLNALEVLLHQIQHYGINVNVRLGTRP